MTSTASLPLVLGPTRGFSALLTVMIFLCFTVPGIIMFFELAAARPVNEDPMTHVYVALSMCAAGVLGAAVVAALVKRKPKTFMTEEGILAPDYSPKLMPWAAIKSVDIDYVHYFRFIKLTVKDRYSIQFPAPSRLRQSLRTGYISVMPLGSGLSVELVWATCEEMVARSRSQQL